MNLFRTVTTLCGVALMGTMLAPGAKADAWDRKTVITFSGPVEIPGVHLKGWGILPAGTYVFKILDSQSDRHIVQISDKDETTVYATILAIPNFRLQSTDKTVISFSERPAGEPEALRAWFYPGRNWGEEFVYPKARAIELAKVSNSPVLFIAAEVPLEVAEPIKSADSPVVVELKRAPVLAIKPTGEEVQMAEVVTAPPADTAVAETSAPVVAAPVAETSAPVATAPVTSLPETASRLPLIAIFGLLALGGGFAVRAAARRV